MDEVRVCAGGCGEEIPATQRGDYKWGHKNGCNKRLSPPKHKGSKTRALARREAEIVIEQPEADAGDYVNCDISVAQLDTIYGLLTPHRKAMAVLSGLDSE